MTMTQFIVLIYKKIFFFKKPNGFSVSVSVCASILLCPNHEDEGHVRDGAFSPAGANS